MRTRVLKERYLLPGETEDGMYRRVADAIGISKEERDSFYEVMKGGKFLPNTPTLVNAGTGKKGGFSACYVLGIDDNLESISKAFNDCMMVHRFYGGTGFNFTKIRPKGSEIESTGGKACGPIKVMLAMNEIVDMISQGGKREGANMGCLAYDHPDILDFIEISGDKRRLGHFNTSIVVDHEFFDILEKNGDVRCLHPATDLIRTIPATIIWDAICKRAWETGSPGLIFQDAINAGNTVPGLGDMTCTNPCISEGQLVLTSSGWIPIEQVCIGDYVMSLGGVTRVVNHMRTGERSIVKLSLKNGMEIKCTPDHKIMTSEGWVPASECKGKFVKFNHSLMPIQDYEADDPELAELTGYWYGDGSIGNNVQFAFGLDLDLAQYYTGLMNKIFNCDISVTQGMQRSGKVSYRTQTGKRLVVDYFEQYNKSIPPLTMDTIASRAFLKGLYSADGHVENNNGGVNIALTSSRREFLQYIQLMLSSLGISSVIYKVKRTGHSSDEFYGIVNSNDSYRLSISYDRHKFIETIGFFQDKKIPKTKAYSINPLSECVSIDNIGEEVPVYDITVADKSHSFCCQGIMVANCGEQPLRENESCNLGSINLSKFVKNRDFDTEEFKRVIRIAVRFLDAVIDRNAYPTEDIERETKRTRKIGLGVMGWADTLILMGYPWRSDDALRLADELGKILKETSRDESHRLSSTWTSFDAIDDSVFTGWGGMRNATTTTIAPTGTLSFLAGCSSGIEPIYDWQVTRKTEQGEEIIPHPLWKMVEGSTLMQDTALNISPDWHLAHVRAWQTNIDNAVSKTVNLRKDATPKDVAYIYAEAFKKGLKGVTIYRDGSRDEQALRQMHENETCTVSPPLPSVREGIERYPAHVYKMNSGCGFCWVIVAERDDKMQNLEHVFVLTDGGCSANNESTGRGISLMLQKDVPVDDICRFLGKVKCFNAMKNPSSQGKSCSDIIGQCIKMEHDDFVDAAAYVVDATYKQDHAELRSEFASCPECGSKLNFESGCGAGTCKICGWSGCH